MEYQYSYNDEVFVLDELPLTLRRLKNTRHQLRPDLFFQLTQFIARTNKGNTP